MSEEWSGEAWAEDRSGYRALWASELMGTSYDTGDKKYILESMQLFEKSQAVWKWNLLLLSSKRRIESKQRPHLVKDEADRRGVRDICTGLLETRKHDCDKTALLVDNSGTGIACG